MIILTAGHTGTGTGAQCATTQFDEGAETIWLRDRIAEILTNRYGLAVLIDNDTASLQLLAKTLTDDNLSLTENTENVVASPAENKKSNHLLQFIACDKLSSVDSVDSVREKNSVRNKNSVKNKNSFLIDIHFNAHTNPNARGTETIVSDDATDLELRIASRFAHITAQTLEIPLRCIKSESQTPHKRLAMLHLTPQSIILEVCFITSPEDAEAYRKNRHKLANKLAQTIAKLIKP